MESSVVDVHEAFQVEGATSLALVVGGGAILVLLLVASIVEMLRNRARAELAIRSLDAEAEIEPGEIVLAGTVELADDAPHAVRVEVEQEGTEKESSGSWSHKWTEVDRNTKVLPFYLVRASGARIRVEPGWNVLLVDELDHEIRREPGRRVRFAELTPGESVIAHGTLTRARDPQARTSVYRNSGDRSLVLRPIGSSPMLLSAEPLHGRFLRHMAAAKKSAFAVGASLAVFLLFTTPYLIAAFGGERSTVTVISRSYYGVRSDASWAESYEVSFQGEGWSSAGRASVSKNTFGGLRKGMRLYYRRVSSWERISHLGKYPTASRAALFFATLAVVVGALVWRGFRHSSRKWYELRRVVDRGPGRLGTN